MAKTNFALHSFNSILNKLGKYASYTEDFECRNIGITVSGYEDVENDDNSNYYEIILSKDGCKVIFPWQDEREYSSLRVALFDLLDLEA